MGVVCTYKVINPVLASQIFTSGQKKTFILLYRIKASGSIDYNFCTGVSVRVSVWV